MDAPSPATENASDTASGPDQPIPRRVALRWIGAANVFAIATFATLYQLWPDVVIEDPVERLLYALELGAIPGAVLLLILQSLWRVVDTEAAESPLLGQESRRWKINQRVMSNSIEQAAIFLPGFIALAIAIDARHTYVLPVLVCMWSIGRLLFWVGYHMRLHYRSFGMDTTFLATLVTYGWLAWRVLIGSP